MLDLTDWPAASRTLDREFTFILHIFWGSRDLTLWMRQLTNLLFVVTRLHTLLHEHRTRSASTDSCQWYFVDGSPSKLVRVTHPYGGFHAQDAFN